MMYFLKNRISAFMVFSGLFIIGIISMTRLPLSLMPKASFPGISVIIEYPGISPEKIETIITKPVEKIIKTVPAIEKVNSVSEEGKSRININFKIDTDIKIAALKVREKIALIRDGFPEEVQEPVVLRYDPSNKPVVIATVKIDNLKLHEIREKVERKLKPKLQRIEGISEINIAGGAQREIHINVDRAKFESKGITLDSIFQTIQSNNTSLPGGIVEHGNKNYIIYSSARYKNISEISNLPLMMSDNGSLIKVYDIGDVKFSFKEKEDIARLDGKEEILLYIHKAGEANTLEVCNNIKKLFKDNKYFKTKIIYNQGKFIQSAIDNVISSCIFGALIVILVLYAFIKRFHMVITIGLSIPVSIILVFIPMYFLNLELNVISLSGLALGAGMIVDNGIVITESIFTQKHITIENIFNSVKRVKVAIISSTATTIAVFFPIIFGNASTKKMYGGLAFTVSSALVISLCVSIVLIPAIYAAFASHETLEFKLDEMVDRVAQKVSIFFRKIFSAILFFKKKNIKQTKIVSNLKKIKHFEKIITDNYNKVFNRSFENKKKVFITMAMLIGFTIIGALSLKSEYIDPISSKEFYVNLEFPTGSSLTFTEKAALKAEQHLKSMEVSKQISTKIEKWRSTFTIKLNNDIRSDKEISDLKDEIKKDLNGIVGKYQGQTFISESNEASSKELNIYIVGNDNKKLRGIAKECAQKLHSISGIKESILRFREGRPEYQILIDKQKTGLSQLSPYDISSFFRHTVFGPVATKFIDDDKEIDVRLRYLKKQRAEISQIKNYNIKTSDGSLMPAESIASFNDTIGPTKIWRMNGRRNVTITAKLGSLSYGDAVRLIDEKFKTIKFPEEYYYEYDDIIKKMSKTQNEMVITIIIAVLFVYMILASLFESFKLPFIIMFTVPLAFIGVIFALLLSRSTLNISVYIGLIVLTGIVVNNGIILVDMINHKVKEKKINKKQLIKIIQEASKSRLRPILITTITTVLGLVPMLFKSGEGSNLWKPLSLTVISGLLFSTMLTLVIIPMLCFTVYSSYLKKTDTNTGLI